MYINAHASNYSKAWLFSFFGIDECKQPAGQSSKPKFTL